MSSKNLRKKTGIVCVILLILFVIFMLGVWFFKQSKTTPEVVEEPVIPPTTETTKKKQDTITHKEPIIDVPLEQESDSIESIEENDNNTTDIFENTEKVHKETEKKKELSSIYIPLTKSSLSGKNLTENQISGKIYYHGENGRLESFIHLDGEGATHEYLVSYNPHNQPVDSLKIGYWNPNTNDKKYATLSVNKISVFENEVRVTEYFINPHMQIRKGRSFSKLP